MVEQAILETHSSFNRFLSLPRFPAFHARLSLTSLGEELRINKFERLLPDDPGRALRLEASVDAFDFRLGEPCCGTQRRNGFRPVLRWGHDFLELAI